MLFCWSISLGNRKWKPKFKFCFPLPWENNKLNVHKFWSIFPSFYLLLTFCESMVTKQKNPMCCLYICTLHLVWLYMEYEICLTCDGCSKFRQISNALLVWPDHGPGFDLCQISLKYMQSWSWVKYTQGMVGVGVGDDHPWTDTLSWFILQGNQCYVFNWSWLLQFWSIWSIKPYFHENN